jgi:hypothetical protein
MSSLSAQAREQAARDAAARVLAPRERGMKVAIRWFAQRSLRVKFLLTATGLFLAYALLVQALTMTGLRSARFVRNNCVDESLSLSEQATCLLALEEVQQKARKAASQKHAEESEADRAKRAVLRNEMKRQRDAATAKKKQEDREAWIKDEPKRQLQAEERRRQAEAAAAAEVRERLVKFADSWEYSDRLEAEKSIERYYREHRRKAELRDEELVLQKLLGQVQSMPVESAIALIVANLGSASAKDLDRAVGDLTKEQRLNDPDQLNAFTISPRRPLYPVVPRVNAPIAYSAIDNKPITPAQLAELQRRDAKWDFGAGITGLYLDCAEHFRELYLGHMTRLMERYLDQYTAPVTNRPQDEVYPLFLLGPQSRPMERLNGALLILWSGKITSEAREKLLQTPMALLGERCPDDRAKFFALSSSLLAAVQVPEDAPILLGDRSHPDAAEVANALSIIYRRCRPWNRPFFCRLCARARRGEAFAAAP